jgi:hypothetical protein
MKTSGDVSFTCSGWSCQIGFMAGFLVVVAFFAVRAVRRTRQGPTYSLAQSELELQTVSGENNNPHRDDDEFDRRRFD